MREKFKTLFWLMVHFIGVLCIGIEIGEAIQRKSMSGSTWWTLLIVVAWIGGYIYISFKN